MSVCFRVGVREVRATALGVSSVGRLDMSRKLQ